MTKILIVGLGPGDLDHMPLGVYRLLKEQKYPVYLRTAQHPVVEELKEEGLDLTVNSFDQIYEILGEQFEQVYEAITDALLALAKEEGEIVYAVPGHPMVAEKTVQLLLEQTEVPVEIVGGQSFLDELFAEVNVDPVEGFQLEDAFELHADTLDTGSPLVVMQVFNDFIAADVKLTLMEKYPDEHQVALVNAAGTKEGTVTWIPLYELDRMEGVYNLLSLYVPPLERDARTRSFDTLQYYMDVLYSEEGDQWIQSQSHEMLLPYLEEETREVAEAFEQEDWDNVAEELGDVLLQVMYHSNLAEREGIFSFEDVLEELNRKIRRRHPHVFDGEKADTIEEIEAIWQRVKAEEREQKGEEGK